MNSPSAAPNFGRLELLLARPRGFCAGVERAIDIVELVLKRFGGPVHVRHELVHNRHVVDDFRRRGVIFVEQLHEVPDGAIVVFSAHGVSEQVQAEAQRRRLTVFDATCPLVTKVHVEVAGHARAGRECILIGHSGHPEVEGTMGRYGPQCCCRRCNSPGRRSGAGRGAGGGQPAAPRVRNPDDPVGGRHPLHFGDSETALSGDHRTAPRRYLLCHSESPGCGAPAARTL